MTSSTGRKSSMMAKRMMPPAMPMTAESAEVAVAATVRIVHVSASTFVFYLAHVAPSLKTNEYTLWLKWDNIGAGRLL